jgi:RNA polymerase sigma-70 factor (ECF subfamily)
MAVLAGMEAVAPLLAPDLGDDDAATAAALPDPEGAQLAAAAAAGSADAFARIVARHQEAVFRLVARMVRDRAQAEDLAQETFLKAYRALRSYDPRWKLQSWLLKIAHNATIDFLRRQRLDTTALETPAEDDAVSLLDHLADPQARNAEQEARNRALARDLQAALQTLDPAYRELLLLRFEEGLAYQEIADVTGLPLGTVKVRLHRGRKRLAELLAARGWGVETPGPEGS